MSKSESHRRGREATHPRNIPLLGWRDIATRVGRRFVEDRITMVAGSVAFFALFSLFPLLIATVSLYGMFTTPGQLESQLAQLTQTLPGSASELLGGQLRRIVLESTDSLSIRAVGGIVVALWSASLGTSRLMEAIGIAYSESEDRNVLVRRGLALFVTLGLAALGLLSLGIVSALPALVDWIGLEQLTAGIARTGRWLVLAVVATGSLAILYRISADRRNPRLQWISWGSILATLLWLIASFGLSIYVENFGSFGETYGALGGVIVLMLWLYLSALAILTGAEINAEIEAQTAQDSTVGRERPMGERGAVKADILGEAVVGIDDAENTPDEEDGAEYS